MSRAFWGKIVLVSLMTFAILFPLEMIRGVISERVTHRQEAIANIAGSYAGEQSITGPVLIIPYVDVEQVKEVDPLTSKEIVRSSSTRGTTYLFPKELQIDGKLEPQTRYRGLHEVRVYEWQGNINARFDDTLPAKQGRTYGAPLLGVEIKDVRGIVGSPRLSLDKQPLEVKNGSGLVGSDGIHAVLGLVPTDNRWSGQISLQLNLAGTESFSLVPIGDNNKFTMNSHWPHPQFAGAFLPRSRNVTAKGFDASWEISALAANTQRQYLAGNNTPTPGVIDTNLHHGNVDVLSVNLVEPINIYSQTDRASKYGLLFVLLTFVGFFMFELIKQLAIHPVQYMLVGLGLTIFFLLLLSLSEHIPFLYAYLVASAACIGLLAFYLSHVLRSKRRGVGFGAMLTALYAALYGLLASEDNALVLGSLLLFAILAAIMVVTRKIDWYQVSSGRGGLPTKPAPGLGS
ncbi:cell envelope integrity protein CreD [Undibacterium sp. TJN25]|uniref:cell envelope integrity protein CreD n=1 Tax=Undibacterium sp. TJN25 TaxID=3413056 RepID=UPI003BF1EED0